ncbi:hypothetical protein BDM02DRAFT_271958 [Thelephora ganbajun]|uniref:Uncharacterized protein n=1 Tax=Thelephora ganbajun TaxID=370292 RepID=A0ACB6Z946_THEGA|nr:hypothetical protein BDM02DRAFT_271958 [Thelephora ganbajun]
MPRRVPLSSRPLDFLYFAFMLIHIPATVLLDMQAICPQHLIPKILRDASEWYITFSGDPLIRGAFHGGPEFNWFRAFLYLEAFFQLPIFFLAARALYAGPPKSQAHYPLMLAYSASSCTTTFSCLAILWTSTGLTQFQMPLLLGSYVPFFLVPFGMAVDMTLRLTKAQGPKTLKAE